jgi:hypothetical protein
MVVPDLIPWGAAASFSWGWDPAASPLGSHPESLIEGGAASMISMKQNDIPALIVSTPDFGPATCRGGSGIGLPGYRPIPGMPLLRRLPVLEAFPAKFFSSPARKTVALFLHLSHPNLLFPTRSVALFRKRKRDPLSAGSSDSLRLRVRQIAAASLAASPLHARSEPAQPARPRR